MEEVYYEKVDLMEVAPDEEKRVKVEQGLETLNKYLDELVTVPGIGYKFGLDSVIGLIPGVGDTATSLVSFYILAAGVRYGVPKVTLLRMGVNIGIDYAVGSIPIAGDVFDFFWKSNKMNMELIRKRATVSAEEAKQGRTSDWIFVGVIMLILVGILFGSIVLCLALFGAIYYELLQMLKVVFGS